MRGQEKVSKFHVIIYRESAGSAEHLCLLFQNFHPQTQGQNGFFISHCVRCQNEKFLILLIAIRGIKMFKLLKSCLWKSFR